MAEKRVVVQVLADTKPFLKSLSRLKHLAEGIDSAQIRRSNSVLKALAQNAKINKQIQKIKGDTNKAQEKAQKSAEESQKRLIKGASTYASVIAGVAVMARSLWGGLKTGYQVGGDIANTARVFGGNPEEVSRARALYSAFGGEPEQGVSAMQKFLQNRLDFLMYQRGPLKEASARFGIDTRELMSGNFEGFVKELRRVRSERNLGDFETQGLLQALGLGGDPALMRMITDSTDVFQQRLNDANKQLSVTREESQKQEELQKSVNTITNNVQTQYAKLASVMTPVVKAFSDINPVLQATIIGIGGAGVAAKIVSLGAKVMTGGAVGSAAGVGASLGSAGLIGSAVLGMPLVGSEIAKGVTHLKRYFTTDDDWSKSYDYAYNPEKYYNQVRNTNITVNVQQPAESAQSSSIWGQRLGEALMPQLSSDIFSGARIR